MKQNWQSQWAQLLKGLKPEVLDSPEEIQDWVRGVQRWAVHLEDQVPHGEHAAFDRFVANLQRVPVFYRNTLDEWFAKAAKWRRTITPFAKAAFAVIDQESVKKTYQENLEGQVVEWVEPLNPRSVAMVREGIRLLNRRWPRRPKMLIVVREERRETLGLYSSGVIYLNPSSFIGGRAEADAVLSVLAHEWGHLIWSRLDPEAQNAWIALWSTKIEIPVQEIHDRVRGDWRQILTLIDEDPYLFTQIMSLEDYTGKTAEEVLAAAHDAHTAFVSVPAYPVSQYGNTKSQEAFCDALGHVVLVGPRAIPAPLYRLLKTMIRVSQVSLKLAARKK